MADNYGDLQGEHGPYHKLALTLAVLGEKVKHLYDNQKKSSDVLDGTGGKGSMSSRVDVLETKLVHANKELEKIQLAQANTDTILATHLKEFAPIKHDVLNMKRAMLAGVAVILISFLTAVASFFIRVPTTTTSNQPASPNNVGASVNPASPVSK